MTSWTFNCRRPPRLSGPMKVSGSPRSSCMLFLTANTRPSVRACAMLLAPLRPHLCHTCSETQMFNHIIRCTPSCFTTNSLSSVTEALVQELYSSRIHELRLVIHFTHLSFCLIGISINIPQSYNFFPARSFFLGRLEIICFRLLIK